ncbi:MAG: type I phosphomannose isomerase catalytic subunit [Chthoniobacter sp.]|uniref:type I phosphomannose isomerase catalytic subunit n=1 Tax=Chthoniobacter sp. TaxID=2510640 RepID=UPI0032A4E382
MDHPLVFEPLFMERVWGGRRLETLLHKHLPPSVRIGEAWELVDREEAQSVVHEGPLRGFTLHELWVERRSEIFGDGLPDTERFPLLCKILDAQERLSVQVHPPADVATRLGGEAKTEMWYLLDASLDSDLYAGLKRGVDRASFERALHEGKVAGQIHSFPIKAGDAMFIPSGRVHAIGAGNLIVEVQQNSDTTYRVFDWNRLGLDGKPRALHVTESMASINFDDVEPAIVEPHGEVLVECAEFHVERWVLDEPRVSGGPGFAIFTVIDGSVECGGRTFERGAFFLLPATATDRELRPLSADARVLRTTVPRQN